MKKNKISVIVALYNAEQYLYKCLDSLVNQTYNNLEIVVVNDGSTDNSEKIILDFLQYYKNIIYIKNKKNSGLSFSRNIGLKKSTGEYIGYIDSDDYVPYDYYQSLFDTINMHNAEVVVCDINVIYEKSNYCERCICGNNENKKIDFINKGLSASACNKLFKRKNIEKYKFEVGRINEDLAVILPTIIEAKKVVYNSDVCYNYIQRDKSIQNSSISNKRFDIFYGVDQTLERINGCDDYQNICEAIIFQQLVTFFVFVLLKEPSLFRRRDFFKKFNKLIKKYDIDNNAYLLDFFNEQDTKHKFYYKILFTLNSNGCYIFSSFLVQMYNFIKKVRLRLVIDSNINMDKLIFVAKKQQAMKNFDISISVVIPNFNYECFLMQRLYSILYQNIKINEIIILDDCSSDNSRILIDELVRQLSRYVTIKKVYNDCNSGSAFKQWKKGIDVSSSDYIWIAEADDYCDKRMLYNLVKPIRKNKNIMISYCDTGFIRSNGELFMRTIVPEIDIMKTGHWKKNYVNSGKREFEMYSFLNCTIANVSSCIIKKDNYDDEFNLSGKFKQAGDWLFYVNVMRKGEIAYCSKTLNFYRVHGNNVSSTTKKQDHLNEIIKIHNYFDNKYGLDSFQKLEISKRYDFLRNVWNIKK